MSVSINNKVAGVAPDPQDVFTQLATGELLIYNAAGTSGSTRWGDEIPFSIASSSVANPTEFTLDAGTVIPDSQPNTTVVFSGVDGTFDPGINTAYAIDRTANLTFTVASNCTVAATEGTATMIIGNGVADHPGAQAGTWAPSTAYPAPLWPIIFPKAGGTLGDLLVRFSNSNTVGDRVSVALYGLDGALIASATGIYAEGQGGHKQPVTFDQANMPAACFVAIQCWQSSDGYPVSAQISTLEHAQSFFGIGGGNIGYSSGPFQSSLNVPSYSADWSSTPWDATITDIAGYPTGGYVSVDKPLAFYAEWTPP